MMQLKSKSVFLVIGVALLLFGGLMWQYLKPQPPVLSPQTQQPQSSPVVIFRVDDILNRTIWEAMSILGKPGLRDKLGDTDEMAIWKKEDITITVTADLGGKIYAVESQVPFSVASDLAAAFRSNGIELRGGVVLNPPNNVKLKVLFPERYGMITVFENDVVGSWSVMVGNRDRIRKTHLTYIASALETYREHYQIYPSTNGTLFLWDADSAEENMLAKALISFHASLYPDAWGLDESGRLIPPAGEQYGYRSDGETYYELSATLDDVTDPECVVEDTLCLSYSQRRSSKQEVILVLQ